MLLPEFLHRMAESFPDEEAYRVLESDGAPGGALTFARWDGLANRLARGLVAAGLHPGDRVVLHLDPTCALRWLAAYAGTHRAGGVAVPINPRLAPAEVGRMLAHAGARVAVADAERVGLDSRLGGTTELVIDASEPLADSHRHDDGGRPEARVETWDDALDPDSSPFQVRRDADDLADILYTSGTTGSPKGVAVRFSNASMVPEGRTSWNGARWLSASPMFTFAGLAFVYNPMKLGMGALYQPRFDPGRWLDAVERWRPTAVFLVPAMAQLLLDHGRFAEADLSSIQLCSLGSAPLAPFVLERLQVRMPDALVSNNYGMTEAGSAYCVMPKGEAVKRPGSVGIPAPPAKVRVVGDGEQEVPTGAVGEVRLRMPGRQREYYGDAEATAATWIDGWVHTGDLGRIDEDGYLYIVGRSKDVIIRGGNNVHAVDVENAILSHPDVLEAAVVGAPHPVLGEDLVAFVVPRGEHRPDPSDLRRHCLDQLADYKVPRRWRMVATLPRNATGKVVKPELRRALDETDDLEVTP